jgi:hypothetical protein
MLGSPGRSSISLPDPGPNPNAKGGDTDIVSPPLGGDIGRDIKGTTLGLHLWLFGSRLLLLLETALLFHQELIESTDRDFGVLN